PADPDQRCRRALAGCHERRAGLGPGPQNSSTAIFWPFKVGDKVREQGKDYDLTVHHIDPPTSGGRAMRYGPTIYVWIGPGRYGTTFDAETSHRFDKV
ncbi:hypothetical protein, partial [Mycobacteroides abscessus]